MQQSRPTTRKANILSPFQEIPGFFMEPEGQLSRLQVSSTGLYPKPNKSSLVPLETRRKLTEWSVSRSGLFESLTA
jgi:hypothetical protein